METKERGQRVTWGEFQEGWRSLPKPMRQKYTAMILALLSIFLLVLLFIYAGIQNGIREEHEEIAKFEPMCVNIANDRVGIIHLADGNRTLSYTNGNDRTLIMQIEGRPFSNPWADPKEFEMTCRVTKDSDGKAVSVDLEIGDE